MVCWDVRGPRGCARPRSGQGRARSRGAAPAVGRGYSGTRKGSCATRESGMVTVYFSRFSRFRKLEIIFTRARFDGGRVVQSRHRRAADLPARGSYANACRPTRAPPRPRAPAPSHTQAMCYDSAARASRGLSMSPGSASSILVERETEPSDASSLITTHCTSSPSETACEMSFTKRCET